MARLGSQSFSRTTTTNMTGNSSGDRRKKRTSFYMGVGISVVAGGGVGIGAAMNNMGAGVARHWSSCGRGGRCHS